MSPGDWFWLVYGIGVLVTIGGLKFYNARIGLPKTTITEKDRAGFVFLAWPFMLTLVVFGILGSIFNWLSGKRHMT